MPELENISVENFVCERANAAFDIQGLPGYPLKGLSFDGVRMAADNVGRITDVRGLTQKDVEISPLPDDGRPKPSEEAYREILARQRGQK